MSINLKSLQNINLTCGTNNDNYIKFNGDIIFNDNNLNNFVNSIKNTSNNIYNSSDNILIYNSIENTFGFIKLNNELYTYLNKYVKSSSLTTDFKKIIISKSIEINEEVNEEINEEVNDEVVENIEFKDYGMEYDIENNKKLINELMIKISNLEQKIDKFEKIINNL